MKNELEERILAILGSDEPNYELGIDLPEEAIEVLEKLVGSDNAAMAARAAWLASKTGYPAAVKVVEAAANHKDPIVRVSAAGALRNIRNERSDALIEKLLDDPDPGVRKVALQSAERARSPRLPEFVKQGEK